MKQQLITFKRPRHVVQIFRKIQFFDKTQKIDDNNKPRPIQYIEWADELYINRNDNADISLGYVDAETNQLYISPKLAEDKYFDSGHGIVLIDHHAESYIPNSHQELGAVKT